MFRGDRWETAACPARGGRRSSRGRVSARWIPARDQRQLRADRVGFLHGHAEMLGPSLLIVLGLGGIEGGDGGRRDCGIGNSGLNGSPPRPQSLSRTDLRSGPGERGVEGSVTATSPFSLTLTALPLGTATVVFVPSGCLTQITTVNRTIAVRPASPAPIDATTILFRRATVTACRRFQAGGWFPGPPAD